MPAQRPKKVIKARALPMSGADRRGQLLDQARQLLEAKGVEGVSLREIADHAGVSRQTPYIYFADGVTEVVAAVADAGFKELITALQESAEPEPRKALVDLGLRYIRFGFERPHLYRAMFHATLAPRLREVENLLQPEGDGEYQNYKDLIESKYVAWQMIKGYATYRSLAESKYVAWQMISLAVAKLTGRGSETAADPGGLAMAALLHGMVGECIDEGLEKEMKEHAPAMIEVLVRGIESGAHPELPHHRVKAT